MHEPLLNLPGKLRRSRPDRPLRKKGTLGTLRTSVSPSIAALQLHQTGYSLQEHHWKRASGGTVNERHASATVVLRWMMSIKSAVLRFAIHRLMFSSIVILFATFSVAA